MSKYTDEEYHEFINNHSEYQAFMVRADIVNNVRVGLLDRKTFNKVLDTVAAWWTNTEDDECNPDILDRKEKMLYCQMIETVKNGIDPTIGRSRAVTKTNLSRTKTEQHQNRASTEPVLKQQNNRTGVINKKINKVNKLSSSSSGSSLNIIGIRDATEKETTTTTTDTNLIPSLDEVKQYAKNRNSKVKPDRFYYYNQTRGWTDKNGQIIKSWKALFKLWEQTERTGENELQDLEF
ncbi:hypothetical protein [Pseudoramibacter porci]|uniref:Uncharacterized protein n=1 Tax=Pseudoramibacter porci TaxID=2606631 RepID=A0A7X2T9T7_9FIRM|nr:hypothetical protein [Pseudoramibacter porci]MSS19148.1 hypothetical protein [Pseudoramibacter porci]